LQAILKVRSIGCAKEKKRQVVNREPEGLEEKKE
jgi:hypothetical protein